MPNYSKKDPKYRAGYRAAKRSATDQVDLIVARIEHDINARSGLSVMLWSDREQREKITDSWRNIVGNILEKV